MWSEFVGVRVGGCYYRDETLRWVMSLMILIVLISFLVFKNDAREDCLLELFFYFVFDIFPEDGDGEDV